MMPKYRASLTIIAAAQARVKEVRAKLLDLKAPEDEGLKAVFSGLAKAERQLRFAAKTLEAVKKK